MKMGTVVRSIFAWGIYLFYIFYIALAVLYSYTFRTEDGQLGAEIFRYFTNDSNILCALTCVPALFYMLRLKKGKAVRMPVWILILRYVGTVSVTLTLVTVMVYLGRIYGYQSMLAGEDLFLHLIGPALMIFTFVFLESDRPLLRRYTWTALIPVLIYGGFYIHFALVLRPKKGGWRDFYALNTGNRWYLSLFIMLAGTYLLGLILRVLHNAMYLTRKDNRGENHTAVNVLK